MSTEPLTAVDVAALRKADVVCFDHNAEFDRSSGTRGSGNRASWIRAIKRVDKTPADPFADGDVTHFIAVESRLTNYGPRVEEWSCYLMVHSARFNEVFRTVALLLRTGDVVRLDWIAGNNCDTLKEYGLELDELRLVVVRGKRPAMTFAMDMRLAPTGSSARMCRPLQYSLV